jgi:hypothetical protein
MGAGRSFMTSVRCPKHACPRPWPAAAAPHQLMRHGQRDRHPAHHRGDAQQDLRAKGRMNGDRGFTQPRCLSARPARSARPPPPMPTSGG